jgi:hypothetical protein
VLRVKLKHLPRFNEAFTIRAERRDAIREALAKEGIASSVF